MNIGQAVKIDKAIEQLEAEGITAKDIALILKEKGVTVDFTTVDDCVEFIGNNTDRYTLKEAIKDLVDWF